MSRWSNDTKPPEKITSRVVDYMKRMNKPVFMGAIAVEHGFAIRQTMWILDSLENAGVVRQLADSEKHKLGIELISIVYALVKEKPD